MNNGLISLTAESETCTVTSYRDRKNKLLLLKIRAPPNLLHQS